MKNYMVTHTFKSKEMKDKFTETVSSMKMEDIVKSMTSDKAACQMTWDSRSSGVDVFRRKSCIAILGDTALIRMPNSAASIAEHRVSAITPAFAAA